MLQVIGGKHTDYTIRARTEQSPSLRLATKCPRYFDIHPFEEFTLLVKDIDVPISSQSKDFRNLDRKSNKNLLLDLCKISRYRLKDLLVLA